MDRHSWRSSLLSNCSLCDETTPKKYTWEKGRATCRYGHLHLLSQLLTSAVAGSLLDCLVLSPTLCYQEKIGDPHQQWMLSQFLGGLCDYYSLSDIKSTYCIATEDLLMIIHLLYKYGRAFHLESVVVVSCWSVENVGWKFSAEARLPRVPLLFSKIVCSSSAHWRLQINLSSLVLFVKEVRVQSLVMLCNLRSQ